MTHFWPEGYDAPQELVGVECIVPQPVFTHVWSMAELAIGHELDFLITVGFIGLRVPHATTDTPTWDEFLSGKALFASELNFSVRGAQDPSLRKGVD